MAKPRAEAWNGPGEGLLQSLVNRGPDMNSWYLPAIPAAAALSFIAYCFAIGF
jgi:hypothetical protein